MEKYEGYSPGFDALAHAGLQGLLAAVPVAAWLKTKETDALTKVLKDVETGVLKADGAQGGLKEVAQAASKTIMREPMIVGAVVVAASMLHGAHRGYHRSKATKRQFEGHVEALTHTEREELRRAARKEHEIALAD